MSTKIWKTIAALGVLGAAAAASATPLTLFDVPTGQEVQQTANRPCIFGDNSCNAGLLGTYTIFPTAGSPTEYTETQSYSIETIRLAAGNAFFIGIDVNTTVAKSEVLDYFRIFDNGVQIYNYEADGVIGNAVDLANGTGFSDWFLKSVDLTSVIAGHTIRFDVHVTNVVDGREQFFLVPTTNGNPPPGEIPEPGSLALLGAGLALAGLYRRRNSTK